MKKHLVKVGALATSLMVPAMALAEPTFTITQPEFDYAQLGTYAGAILTALAAVWLIRKFIKITNRS